MEIDKNLIIIYINIVLSGGWCIFCLFKSNKGNGIFVFVKNNLIFFM